jgi:hypothetical protein
MLDRQCSCSRLGACVHGSAQDVHGGGAPSALLLLPRDGIPAQLPRTAPGTAPRAAPSNGSWRVGCDTVLGSPFSPPLFPLTPPVLSPGGGRTQKTGKNPKRFCLREGLDPGVVELGQEVRGQTRTMACPGWLAGRVRRRGVTAVDGDVTFGMAAEGIGVFSPGQPRCWHTGAPWLGVHASRRPDHPITRALVRYDSARCEVGKGGEE